MKPNDRIVSKFDSRKRGVILRISSDGKHILVMWDGASAQAWHIVEGLKLA